MQQQYTPTDFTSICKVQQVPKVLVHVINICAVLEEQLGDLEPSSHRGNMKRSCAPICPCLGICLVLKEQFSDLEMPCR
jgi:hypothetical protein